MRWNFGRAAPPEPLVKWILGFIFPQWLYIIHYQRVFIFTYKISFYQPRGYPRLFILGGYSFWGWYISRGITVCNWVRAAHSALALYTDAGAARPRRKKKSQAIIDTINCALKEMRGVLLLAYSYHAASQLHYVLSVCKCVCVCMGGVVILRICRPEA